MKNIVRAFEKCGYLVRDVDFVPLAFIIGLFYFLTIPIWLPLYVLATFAAELTPPDK